MCVYVPVSSPKIKWSVQVDFDRHNTNFVNVIYESYYMSVCMLLAATNDRQLNYCYNKPRLVKFGLKVSSNIEKWVETDKTLLREEN